MSYRVELLETKIGRLTPADYEAELNAFAKDGYKFVQAITLDLNRSILIFERFTSQQDVCIVDGIKWL